MTASTLTLPPHAARALASLIEATGGPIGTPLHNTKAIARSNVAWHRDQRDRDLAASRYASACADLDRAARTARTLAASPRTARPTYSAIVSAIEEEIRAGQREEIAASIMADACAGHGRAVIACLMSEIAVDRRDTMSDLTDAEIAACLDTL